VLFVVLVVLTPWAAMAAESPSAGQAPVPAQSGAPSGAETGASSKAPALSGDLVKLLEERQQELDRREAAIRRDEDRLKILHQDIESMLKKQNKSGGAQPASPMAHLSQAFESMPAEEAAQRIEKMNEASALDLLTRLKSKTVGQILASVNPAKAARLSEKLAARR
jgi:flagellar motility protein MotE (MotC chaperone)